MLSGVVSWDVIVGNRESVIPSDPVVFDEVLGVYAGNVMSWMAATSSSSDWNLTIKLKKDEEFEYFMSLSETGEWMMFRKKITEEKQ